MPFRDVFQSLNPFADRGVTTEAEKPAPKRRSRKEPTVKQDVEQIHDQFKQAGEWRASLGVEIMWARCRQMVEGGKAGQWYTVGTSNRLRLPKDWNETQDLYTEDPLILPLVRKHQALATQSQPDANAMPETQAEKDILAANQANRVAASTFRDNGGANRYRSEAVFSVDVEGLVYGMQAWNPHKKAAIPQFDPQTNQVSGRVLARAGAVDLRLLPAYQVYLQPGVRKWRDVQWLIVAELTSLSALAEEFGADAVKNVKPDQATDTADFFGAYLPGGSNSVGGYGANAGNLFGSRDPRNRGVFKLSYFQLPSTDPPNADDETGEQKEPDYPDGRHVVIAGDQRLYNGPLPYGDGFPLSRLCYQEVDSHPYGRGLVADLIGAQVRYNRMLTKIVNGVEAQKNTLMVNQRTAPGADVLEAMANVRGRGAGPFFNKKRDHDEVWYDGLLGEAPGWSRAPDVSRDVYELMNLTWTNMQTIAGIQDVDLGKTGSGTPGVAIDLLQQSSRAQISTLTAGVEQFEVETQENIIQCFAKNAHGDLPRLMGLDQTGEQGHAFAQAMSFRELTSGGAWKVYCVPGSATPKSPAGQQQQIFDLAQANLLDPANPQSLTALSALNFATNSPIYQNVLKAGEKQKAEAAEQAQQAQAAQARQMQMQAQINAQTEAAKAAAKPEQAPDNSLQLEAVKQEGQARTATIKAQGDVAAAAVKHENELKKSEVVHAQNLERDEHQTGLDVQAGAVRTFLSPPPMPPTNRI